jgi:hypothetical protein
VSERIMGPATATDGNLFAADGATGKLAKDSAIGMANVALLGGRAGGQVLIGSTSTDSGATIRATSGVGASGSDIIFQVGNNGETEAMRILYDGKIGIGTATPAQKLDILSGAIRFSYMTAPDACTAAELDEAGSVTVGNHYVKITFVTAIGETDIGTASSVVAAAGSKKIRCTSIPVGTASTVTDRRVWMTKAGGTTYYLVAAVGDNTTTQYDINVADAALIFGANTLGGTSSGRLYAGTTRIGGIDSGGYLDLWQDKDGDNKLVIRNDSTGTSARAGFGLHNGLAYIYFNLCGTGYTGIAAWQNQFVLQSGAAVTAGMRVFLGAGNFIFSRTATDANDFVVAASGNIGIGTATFGTSAARVLGMAVGTATTTSPASAIQMWAADVGAVADKAGLHIRSEGGGVVAFRSPAGTLNTYTYQNDAIADDGTVVLPDATSGICIVSCNAEAGIFLIQTSGAVTLLSSTTGNVAVADTDTDLCVYDSGTGATVKNRLGATGELRIVYYYN